MKNLLLLLFMALCFPYFGASQNYLWAEKIGGPNFDVVSDIDVDNANNSVVVGQFFGSLTFGTTTLTSNGTSDGFAAKLDQDGNPVWIVQVGGDAVSGVKIDQTTGDVYITGSYNSTFTIAGITLPYISFGPDAFLIKISSSGTVLWAKAFNGSGGDAGIDVIIDEANGSVYTMGVGADTLNIGTQVLTAATGQFVYVAKYSTAGVFQWVKQFNTGATISSGFGIKQGGIDILSNNDIVITGNFRGTIGFDAISLTVTGSTFDYDGYVARINGAGVVQWAQSFGSILTDYSNGIAVDVNDNIWLTGLVGSPSNFGSITLSGGGGNNIFFAKYNSAGTAVYAYQTTDGSSNESNGIDVDSNGNVYIIGNYFNPITFGSFTLNNGNLGSKYFIVKFSSNSNTFEWALDPDFNQAFSPTVNGVSVVVSSTDDLFAIGKFSGTLDFSNTTLVTSGSDDIFVTRLGDCSGLNAQLSAIGSTNVCAGSTRILEADTANSYEYKWLFNGAVVAGELNNTLTVNAAGLYSVVIDSLGCIDTSATIAITVSPLPTVSHSNLSPVCQDDAPFTLQGGSPAGGVYSGSAVVATNTFNPAIANLGTNLVTYTYTDANSCSDSVTKTIVVNQTPAIFINSISACENGSPVFLGGPAYGFPQGGTHTGQGMVGSLFIPSVAGVGTHIINYTTSAGCAANDSITAIVSPGPTVSVSPIPTQCITSPFVPLATYGSPFGGSFSGPGVSSNFFYPAIAGVGTHEIVYAYSVNGCTAFDTVLVTVDPLPNVSFAAIPNLCEGDSLVLLTNYAAPSGGIFSGVGIVNNSIFNPDLVGVGSYVLQYSITNACGTDSASVNVNVNELPAISVTTTNISCNGLANGSAVALATLGQAPYTYTWSNSLLGSTQNGLNAGFYTVTVADANGCTDTSNFTITEPTPLISTISTTNLTCNAGTDGTTTVSVFGGTPSYTYAWSSGDTSETATNLSAGLYTVTITDINFCSIIDTAIIIEPSPLNTVVSTSNISCFGESSGTASIVASGGTPGYTYLWNTGNTGATISGLTAGNYIVTTTDNLGCTVIDSVAITQPNQPLTIALSSFSNTSCFNGNDGVLQVASTGGTPPYSYNWNNGSTNASINGLTSGIYSVTVTDVSGCLDSLVATINDPSPLSVFISATNLTCTSSSDGTAAAVVSGGVLPYNYQWNNGQNSATVTGLAAGTFSVTITDLNGCTIVDSVVLSEPSQLITTFNLTQVSCFGGNNGSISVSASGGTPNYSYLWSNGSTNSALSNLTAGDYSVTVTDSNGCFNTDTLTITEPSLPLTLTIDSLTQVSCFGGNDGAISTSANGGTAPYSFLWNKGSTNNSINNLTTGSYSVTLTDANGCETLQVLQINQPTTPVSASIVSSTNAICVGSNNGNATAAASGGTPGYTFNWSNGAPTPTISGLVIGNYQVTISDLNGCIDTTSIDIIPAPTAAVASISNFSNTSCLQANDGSAQVSVVGGTLPYTYLWSNGETTAAISGLAIGNYSVTVNSSNGCTDTASIEIINADTIAPFVVTVNDTVYLSAFGTAEISIDSVRTLASDNCGIQSEVLNKTTFTCADIGANSVSVTVTDSSGNVTVQTPTVFVLDTISPTILASNTSLYLDAFGFATLDSSLIDNGTFDNCGIASYSLSQINFDCSSAGQVIPVAITVVDVNGNSSINLVNVTIIDTVSPILNVQNVTVYLDSLGSVTVDSAAIDNGTFDACGIATLTLSKTIFNCSDLGTNSVTVTATDANGNSSTSQVTVIVLDTLAPIILSTDTTVYLNGNGTFTIDPTYINSSSYDNCSIDTMYLSRSNFSCSDLGIPQSVMLYVLDENGNLDSTVNFVNVLDTLSPTVLANSIQLYLDSSGSASFSPTLVDAGTFDNCGIDTLYLSQTTFNCNDLGNLTIQLFAIDASGNMSETMFNVAVLDTIAPTILANNITLYLDATGNATASVDSANAGTVDNCNLSSIWLNEVNFTCSNIGINTTQFNAIDNSGNQSSIPITITVLDTISPSVFPFQNVVLSLDSNGQALLSVAQADSATTDCDLDSLWLSQTVFTCANIGFNSVVLKASDGSGNIDSAAFTVVVIDTLSHIEIIQNAGINCHGDSTGIITAVPSGMFGQYAYLWNTGDTTAQLSNLAAGNYFVTTTSANGCLISDSISISEPLPYNTALTASSDSLCAGDSTAFISLSVQGNNAPYSFIWNNGSTNDSLIGIGAGQYFVTISDVNDCRTIDSIQIELINCDSVDTSSHSELFSEDAVAIYPNPTSSIVNINFGNWHTTENVRIFWMNSLGQLIKVFDQSQWTQIKENEIQIEVDNASSGVYLLVIHAHENIATKRFVIEK